MTPAIIAKYKSKSIPSLIAICVRNCHEYIRLRDKGKPCISCGKFRTLEAGHYQSGGKYSRIRFNELNINGQCKQCNYYGGMEIGAAYRVELVNRIGVEKVENLEKIAADKTPFKWDRFDLIEKIEYYKDRKKLIR